MGGRSTECSNQTVQVLRQYHSKFIVTISGRILVPSTVRRVKRKKCLCVCVCVCRFVEVKETSKNYFFQTTFFEVFRYGDDEFECYAIRNSVGRAHVTTLHFWGQRNIKKLFFSNHVFLVFRNRETGSRYYPIEVLM